MLKKVFGLSIVGASALALSSCGDDTFTIWTFSDEAKGFVEEYIEEVNPEYDIDVVVVPTAEFQGKKACYSLSPPPKKNRQF